MTSAPCADETAHPLLVLDLDETLFHASPWPLPFADDLQVENWWIYRRPGLEAFLRGVAQWYELAVWSSATADYANGLIPYVFPEPGRLRLVWARERCTLHVARESRDTVWIKDFTKLRRRGYSLARVLAVDDSPEKHARNYGNLVRVNPFEGDPADRELSLLLPYLEALRHQPDLRQVEKRGWQQQASRMLERTGSQAAKDGGTDWEASERHLEGACQQSLPML